MASTDFMNSQVKLDLTNSSNYHNRVLVVGEKRFYVGADILATWSEHFRGMFSGSFSESKKTEIEIEDVDSSAFEAFLYILYQNNDSSITADLLTPLIDLSYRFLAPNVLRICEKYIEKNIKSLHDVYLDLLHKACEYNIIYLKKKMLDHFDQNRFLLGSKNEDLMQCAEQYNLIELKKWITVFIEELQTEEHSEKFLKDYETHGEGAINDEELEQIAKWNVQQIQMDLILPLVKIAVSHDIKVLKKKLHA